MWTACERCTARLTRAERHELHQRDTSPSWRWSKRRSVALRRADVTGGLTSPARLVDRDSALARYFAAGQTGSPGSATSTLQREPPAVMNSVLRLSPPNAQFVVSSRGMESSPAASPPSKRRRFPQWAARPSRREDSAY